MAFAWLTWSNPVSVWWCFLVGVSAVNILFWMWTMRSIGKRDLIDHPARPHIRAMQILSALYVFGCAFRAVLPRADVQRFSLFNTDFSSVLIGRSVATIAELSFVLQWAIVLHYLSRLTQSHIPRNISYIIVPLVSVAELCSWYAVITKDYLGNVFEESIWGLTFLLIAAALFLLRKSFRGVPKFLISIVIVGLISYALFMFTVDVPMYFQWWHLDTLNGAQFLGFVAGVRDLRSDWIVTYSLAQWKPEIAWMTLYFSVAVWTSIALCWVALFKDRLPEYMDPMRER